jgi:hypothetical protein
MWFGMMTCPSKQDLYLVFKKVMLLQTISLGVSSTSKCNRLLQVVVTKKQFLFMNRERFLRPITKISDSYED